MTVACSRGSLRRRRTSATSEHAEYNGQGERAGIISAVLMAHSLGIRVRSYQHARVDAYCHQAAKEGAPWFMC